MAGEEVQEDLVGYFEPGVLGVVGGVGGVDCGVGVDAAVFFDEAFLGVAGEGFGGRSRWGLAKVDLGKGRERLGSSAKEEFCTGRGSHFLMTTGCPHLKGPAAHLPWGYLHRRLRVGL